MAANTGLSQQGYNKKLPNEKVVLGFDIMSISPSLFICKPCIAGITPRLDISKVSNIQALGMLDIIHSEVGGPLQIPWKGGAKYFITFIDKLSHRL